MITYKFIKVRTDQSDEEVSSILNNLSKEGWKVHSFYPTSDNELGKTGIFNKDEPWDIGYAFLLSMES